MRRNWAGALITTKDTKHTKGDESRFRGARQTTERHGPGTKAKSLFSKACGLELFLFHWRPKASAIVDGASGPGPKKKKEFSR